MRLAAVRLLLALTLIVGISSNAQAQQTYQASGCCANEIQNAFNAVTSGETILVPGSCSCTWSSQVIVPSSLNQVTLQGGGIGSTTIDLNRISQALQIASSIRVTGFTFKNFSNNGATNPGITCTGSNWRIDHNDLQLNVGAGIATFGDSPGLIDHNDFEGGGNAAINPFGGANDGQGSWGQANFMGTANNTFIEYNTFTDPVIAQNGAPYDGAVDSYGGAHYVFRDNTVSSTYIGGHGFDSGPWESTLLQEVYGNNFSDPGNHINLTVDLRGGTAIVFNNIVAQSQGGSGGFDSVVDLQEYRASSAYVGSDGNNWDWCNGSSSYDGNQTSFGYPCRDQVGRGLTTSWTIGLNGQTGVTQKLAPVYAWNNNFGGQIVGGAVLGSGWGGTDYLSQDIVENRDYYNYTASFNGNSGVGQGVFSARPSNCTPNVAYWATDKNTLYQCTATNTWSVYYTPFTDPFPLTASGFPNPSATPVPTATPVPPAPPENLHVL